MSRPRHVHVVGAGLAGLSAALACLDAGAAVTLHEQAPQAGGRCRSYFDQTLGRRIDNGNHLLLSANRATFAYLDRIGAAATLAGPATPLFPFMDLASGERWALRPNPGPIPWWLLSPGRSVPGLRLRELLPALSLHRAAPERTVADALPHGALYRRLLEPFAVAALNSTAEQGSARLLGAVLRESLARGGSACLPRYPREGLSESLIDPALATLAAMGAEIRLGARIGRIETAGARVCALDARPLAADEAVILAVPAQVAAGLLPWLRGPDAFESIVNVHFLVDAAPPPPVAEAGFIGLVGGLAEWVFVRPGIVSTTTSAANRHAALDNAAFAQQVWHEVERSLHREAPLPPCRVVREKRATFLASPAQLARRPVARTGLNNLALAGDWTETGLPATIEGAIRSGRTAAAILL